MVLEEKSEKGAYINTHWALHRKLTSLLPLAAALFVLNVHKVLRRLSLLMQTSGVALIDVNSAVNKSVAEVRDLETNGCANLSRF